MIVDDKFSFNHVLNIVYSGIPMPPPAILLPEEFLGIIRISDKERQIIEHFRKDVFEVIYRLNHGSFKVFSSDNTAAAIRDLISDLFGLKRN